MAKKSSIEKNKRRIKLVKSFAGRRERLKAIANNDAQILGERRLRVIDRLILADEATQLGGKRPRARFQRGIGEDFVGLDRTGCRRRGQQCEKSEKSENPHFHSAGIALGGGAVRDLARRATPTRKRLSESDSNPPSAMTSAPIQISDTSGFQ